MTHSIAPLSTDLFRLMELEPLRLPDRVASYPVSINPACLTEQERKWLAEAQEVDCE